MSYPYQPETYSSAEMTQEEKVSSLLDTLDRFAAALIRDIESEEQRSGVHDSKDPCYSALAHNLRERERNIRSTISSLLGISARRS
jgi:hypothetical protein